MKFEKTLIKDLSLIRPETYKDKRGSFRRYYCQQEFKKNKTPFDIKQINISENFKKGTLRGFHYQSGKFAESKIFTPVRGSVYLVVVDLRKKSKTFLKKIEITIDSRDHTSVLIPKGCANAFLTLEDNTVIIYNMSQFYSAKHAKGFHYLDPLINVKWPIKPKVISEKDKELPLFKV